MTVSVQTPYNSSTGNGVTTVFPYSFQILSSDDLKVTVDGTLKAIGTDYTVSGVGSGSGGNVTFGSAPANGAIVVRYSDTLMKRETDYQANGDFREVTVDADFDRMWLGLRDVQRLAQRAIRVGPGEASPVELPSAATRANKVLGFDASGAPTASLVADIDLAAVSTFVATLLDDTTALAFRTTLGVPEGGRGAGTSTPVEGLTDSNTAVGLNALVSNVDGYENTAVGVHALRLNTTGTENNAFGTLALESNTTGAENVGVGVRALWKNVDGNDNTAVGHAAMNANVSGDDNTAIGQTALYRLTGGDRNTAVGRQALEHLLTGSDNTAVGHSALSACTGSTNTAIGRVAGAAVTSGSGNTLAGYSSASSLTTGNFNCIVGYQAMNVATGASNCVYVGYQAGYVSTGNNNTGVGNQSMLANTDGTDNVGVGILSLSANTSGDGNVGVGNLALSSNTTGDHNTAVGMSAFSSGTGYSNSSCFGYNAQVTGSNQVQLGDSSTTTYVYGTVQNRSDARDKADVRDTVLGLDFVNSLRPVDFRYAYREDSRTKRARYHHGLIAQEVAALSAEFGGVQHHAVNGGGDVWTIGYDELIAPLIRAVQQLSARVAELEAAG